MPRQFVVQVSNKPGQMADLVKDRALITKYLGAA